MIRTLLLTLLCGTISYSLAAQNCSVGSFSTQASIDNFAAQYAGCTLIDGEIVIEGADITNLDGLAGITRISSFLHINNCPLLTDISGLSSLTEVGGEINIENNPKLENLVGLEGLTIANFNLRVVYNLKLSDSSSQISLVSQSLISFKFSLGVI